MHRWIYILTESTASTNFFSFWWTRWSRSALNRLWWNFMVFQFNAKRWRNGNRWHRCWCNLASYGFCRGWCMYIRRWLLCSECRWWDGLEKIVFFVLQRDIIEANVNLDMVLVCRIRKDYIRSGWLHCTYVQKSRVLSNYEINDRKLTIQKERIKKMFFLRYTNFYIDKLCESSEK